MTEKVEGPGGINLSFMTAALCGTAAYLFWPGEGASFHQQTFAFGVSLAAAACAAKGATLLKKDMQVRSHIRESEEASTEYGSAREATRQEILDRGCGDPGSGSFIGFADDMPVFVPADIPFSIVEAPPGTGKGINLVLNEILHHSLLGHSVFAPDVKCELAPMLAESLRTAGVETWCINPARRHEDICGNDAVGLYDALIKAAHAADIRRKDAVGIAEQIAKLHLPDKDTDKSKLYFVGGSRRLIKAVALLKALIDPANCNPGEVLLLLNDASALVVTLRTIIDHLEPFCEDDRIVVELKSEAKNLLHRHEHNPENFGSFLEWATQALAPYNQAGHLTDTGQGSPRDLADMTNRPVTTFVMTPLSHAGEFESFTSILNANLIAACKHNPRKQRVHLVCDEMLNYRFANIASDLETMRGLGVTATFYIQSFSGLVRQYGKETAASVNDYCDCKIYAGINSYERAKYVSDMLSEATVNGKDYSYKSLRDDVNISSKRHARRLMTADEILAMPSDEAWVFLKGIRPFRLKLTHYGHITPWDRMVGGNPLEGPPLRGSTLLEIIYHERNAS